MPKAAAAAAAAAGAAAAAAFGAFCIQRSLRLCKTQRLGLPPALPLVPRQSRWTAYNIQRTLRKERKALRSLGRKSKLWSHSPPLVTQTATRWKAFWRPHSEGSTDAAAAAASLQL